MIESNCSFTNKQTSIQYIMSTWQDLIDDISVQRFVAGNGSDEGSTIEGIATVSQSNTSTLVDPPGVEAQFTTSPPPAEVLYGTELIDDVSNGYSTENDGGITILSSVLSVSNHDTVSHHIPSYPHHHHNDNADNISWMTEESASLTLHPDSLDSSIMTDFTEGSSHIASLSEVRESTTLDGAISENTSLSSYSFEGRLREVNSRAPKDKTRHFSTTEHQQLRWYNNMDSEQEWDHFRSLAIELLDAMECPLGQRDEILSQLIAAEEEAFRKSPKKLSATVSTLTKSSWVWEIVALAATVAISSIAIFRLLKAR